MIYLYIIYVYHEGPERLLLAALGFYNVCGRCCIGKYCGDNLICLRKGSRGPKACVKCVIGVKSKIDLCMDCGHDLWAHYIAYRERQNRLAATQPEFSRLAAIEM